MVSRKAEAVVQACMEQPDRPILDVLKEQLREQEEWGKWNVAPLANRIARLEEQQRSPLARAARRVLDAVGLSVLFAVSLLPWLVSLKPVLDFFSR